MGTLVQDAGGKGWAGGGRMDRGVSNITNFGRDVKACLKVTLNHRR